MKLITRFAAVGLALSATLARGAEVGTPLERFARAEIETNGTDGTQNIGDCDSFTNDRNYLGVAFQPGGLSLYCPSHSDAWEPNKVHRQQGWIPTATLAKYGFAFAKNAAGRDVLVDALALAAPRAGESAQALLDRAILRPIDLARSAVRIAHEEMMAQWGDIDDRDAAEVIVAIASKFPMSADTEPRSKDGLQKDRIPRIKGAIYEAMTIDSLEKLHPDPYVLYDTKVLPEGLSVWTSRWSSGKLGSTDRTMIGSGWVPKAALLKHGFAIYDGGENKRFLVDLAGLKEKSPAGERPTAKLERLIARPFMETDSAFAEACSERQTAAWRADKDAKANAAATANLNRIMESAQIAGAVIKTR